MGAKKKGRDITKVREELERAYDTIRELRTIRENRDRNLTRLESDLAARLVLDAADAKRPMMLVISLPQWTDGSKRNEVLRVEHIDHIGAESLGRMVEDWHAQHLTAKKPG